MHIVRGRTHETITREQLLALVEPCARVALDIGAGDGSWAYRHASAHTDVLVIALDPVAENMREWSAKAAKKPGKGGLPNVLFAVGSVEQPPPELHHLADEITVTLPWGSLMRGLILGDDAILAGIASFAKDGASVRIVLNTRIYDDPVPIEARDLPDLTPDHVRDVLIPAYDRHDLEITAAREMQAEEVAAIGTTWGKRLSHRRPPPSILIEARRTTSGQRLATP